MVSNCNPIAPALFFQKNWDLQLLHIIVKERMLGMCYLMRKETADRMVTLTEESVRKMFQVGQSEGPQEPLVGMGGQERMQKRNHCENPFGEWLKLHN